MENKIYIENIEIEKNNDIKYNFDWLGNEGEISTKIIDEKLANNVRINGKYWLKWLIDGKEVISNGSIRINFDLIRYVSVCDVQDPVGDPELSYFHGNLSFDNLDYFENQMVKNDANIKKEIISQLENEVLKYFNINSLFFSRYDDEVVDEMVFRVDDEYIKTFNLIREEVVKKKFNEYKDMQEAAEKTIEESGGNLVACSLIDLINEMDIITKEMELLNESDEDDKLVLEDVVSINIDNNLFLFEFTEKKKKKNRKRNGKSARMIKKEKKEEKMKKLKKEKKLKMKKNLKKYKK